MRALLLSFVLILAAGAGCTDYHYIVRRDGAPLFSDAQRTAIVGRLDRLADGYMGHSEPVGDPVKIRYRGGEIGWANRADLRIFRYANDVESREEAVFYNRREVELEGKDWPEPMKQAVRESRLENGMTKEMVELALGPPTSTELLEGGGERWTIDRPRWDVRDTAYWDGYSGTRLYYGFGPWGPGFGFGYEWPAYEPRYFRTYYARTERRTVTFSAAGTVTGWQTSGY
jgi:hypothetical protein